MRLNRSGRSVVAGGIAGLGLAAGGLGLARFAWTRDLRWFELYTTRLGCITDLHAPRIFAAERWAGVTLGVLIVVLSWPAARAVARRTPRALLAACGRFAVAIGLALVVCELALRIVHPHPAVMTNLPTADPDGRLGWRYRPLNAKVTEFVGDGLTVEYDVDSVGDRARTATEAPDLEAPTLLFSGESITAGIGVRWEDSFPALVSGRLGIHGANLGVHGYGPDQIYLRAVEALDTFRHPVALVTLVMADYLERSTSPGRPHLVLARDGSLVLSRPWAPWDESALRDLLARVTEYARSDEIAVVRAILRATVARARERGALPLFVMTNWGPPCLPDASGAPPVEHVLFDDLGAAHIRVDLDPTWRLHDDPHPDARASRKLADAIAQELVRLGVTAPSQ
jgi:hypothetical protein